MDDPMTRTSLSADTAAVRRRADEFAGAIRGQRPPDPLTGEMLLWEVHQRMESLCANTFTERFRCVCLETNETLVEESRHRNHSALPAWDDCLEYRRVNAFGFWATIMVEFSVSVDMT